MIPQPPPPPRKKKEKLPTPEEAIALLWSDGDLEYLLRPVQQEMRAAIAGSEETLFVVECSRRLGKSFFACLIAIEHALQKPKSLIRFAAPTKKALQDITSPLFREILTQCPKHLKPTWVSNESKWVFPNGSEIFLAGVNGDNADNLRGTATDLAVVDEAAFVDRLSYLVQDVLMPQVIDRNGRLVLISTPPKTPAHDFLGYVKRAQEENSYFKRTIFDATHITQKQIDKFMRDAGGATSTTWRREYLCEHITDAEKAVLPEFGDCKPHIVIPQSQVLQERPRHFIPIVVGDIGYNDLTFVVFGYHDFRRAIDVIEGEVVVQNTIASEISRLVEAKAISLWGEDRYKSGGMPPTGFGIGTTPPRTGIRHYADSQPITIAELGSWWHSIPKGGKAGTASGYSEGTFMQAAINDLRTRIANKTLRISREGCPKLIAHLEYAIWDSSGRDFIRQGEFGHFDGVAACAYFVRLVNRSTNPFPHLEGITSANSWIQNPGTPPVAHQLAKSARQVLKERSKYNK